MGGRKRKHHEEEESKIWRKIRRLEKKLQRSRRVISSSASDNNDLDVETEVLSSPASLRSPAPSFMDQQDESMPEVPVESPAAEVVVPNSSDLVPSTSVDNTANTTDQVQENILEVDILRILGDVPQPDLEVGKDIHKDIASRWQDILLKGLSKEVKEPILKRYIIPGNCNWLIAPILNPEAKAAVPEILAKRDNTLLQKQNQIGVALSALSQLSEMILRNETSKQVLLQPLSDACRLLCDSHHIETKTRRSILISSINTSLRETLVNVKRDKYLFGEDLTEKLKAAKTVQRTGESLLKVAPATFTSKTANFKNNPKRNLNYRGSIPKIPPNRGSESSRGRPPVRQTGTAAYSRRPPPPPSSKLTPPPRSYRR